MTEKLWDVAKLREALAEAQERHAASEAARERLVMTLKTCDGSHVASDEWRQEARDALSASPSAVLAEREAGLKARIAQLEKERDKARSRVTALAQAAHESNMSGANVMMGLRAERDAAMATAAMLREALDRAVGNRDLETVQNGLAALRESADVSAWLSERLKQEREAGKSEALDALESHIRSQHPAGKATVHVFTQSELAEHDAKVRAAARRVMANEVLASTDVQFALTGVDSDALVRACTAIRNLGDKP